MIRLSVTPGEAQSNRIHYRPGIFFAVKKNRIYNYKVNNGDVAGSEYKLPAKNPQVSNDRKRSNPDLKIGASTDQDLSKAAGMRRANSNQVDLSSKKVLGKYPDFLDRGQPTTNRHQYYTFALGKNKDIINTTQSTRERMAWSIDNQKLETPNGRFTDINGVKIFSPNLKLNQTQECRTQEDLILEKLQKIMDPKVGD
jgi:hypothetical protein